MNFRTPISVKRPSWNILWSDPLLTLGSCFSDSIGNRLNQHKFNALVNPFGTLYHPLAIFRTLEYACLDTRPPAGTYVQRDDVFVNLDFHSSFNQLSKAALQEGIGNRIAETHRLLKKVRVVMLTFGTAYVFEKEGRTVANCHKLPANQFTRRLVGVDEMVKSFSALLPSLLSIQPDVRLILTVSPVRHLRDSLTANSASKAMLRIMCEELTKLDTRIAYFPAFEIMMDDLRDYRFYDSDLIHPSRDAEDYIWDRFMETFFTNDLQRDISEWGAISQSLAHRPFLPGSKGHTAFLQDLIQKVEKFSNRINTGPELEQLRAQLSSRV